MKRLSIPALIGVALALLFAGLGTAPPAWAASNPVPIYFQKDPCPGASLCGTFLTGRFKGSGKITPQFAALPNLTVARASFAYGENADGSLKPFQAGQARLTSKGLGVFEATTNLEIQSGTFTGYSSASLTVAASAVPAPDPSQTAVLLTSAAGANAARTHPTAGMTVTNGTVYTGTAYLQAGTANGFVSFDDGGGTVYAYAKLNPSVCATSAITLGGTGTKSATATPAANGWCRVALTWTSTVTSTLFSVGTWDGTADQFNYPGTTGAKTLYAWGTDVRAGAYPVPYCPTAASTATCAADQVSFANGAPVGSSYTLMAAFDPAGLTAFGSNRDLVNIGTNRGLLYITASGYQNAIEDVTALSAEPLTSGAQIVASAFSPSLQTYSAGGVPFTSTTNATADGAGTTLYLGQKYSGTQFANGYIRGFAVYPTALSAARVQALTSGPDLSSLSLNFAAGLYKTTTPYVRTNYVANSQDVSSWSTLGAATTRTANFAAAPDGTITSNRIVYMGGTGTANDARIETQPVPAGGTASKTFTASGWIRSTGSVAQVVRIKNSQGSVADNFSADLTVGPAWQRYSLTVTNGGSAGSGGQITGIVAGTANAAFDVQIWGWQLENQGSPSSYIATTGAAASVATTQSTNPADVGALSYTGPAGYAPDCNGNLVSFAANNPRITCAGVLIEEARTNKNTNTNVNPQSLTNVTKAGDAAATLTLVDDSAALAAIGLTGNVFKLDNTAGSTDATAVVGGAAGNTNAHVASAYVRKTGSSTVNVELGGVSASGFATAAYTRLSASGTASAGATTVIRVKTGAVGYFILNQLEEGSFVTSPIPVAGASATRPADVMSYGGMSFAAPTTFAVQGVGYSQDGVTRRFLTLSDGSVNNRVMLSRLSDNSVSASAVNGGAAQGSSVALSGVTGAFNVSAVSNLAAGVYKSAANGTLAGASNSSAPSVTFSRLDVGQAPDGTGTFNGSIPQIRIYPYPANDNELSYRSAGNF